VRQTYGARLLQSLKVGIGGIRKVLKEGIAIIKVGKDKGVRKNNG